MTTEKAKKLQQALEELKNWKLLTDESASELLDSVRHYAAEVLKENITEDEQKQGLNAIISQHQESGSLTDLISRSDAQDLPDLVNHALTLWETAIEHRERGRFIASVDPDTKKFEKFEIPGLRSLN